ncbi:N-lysine methyltransferase KMT5A-A-like [Notolabrus celidotus]|uniref:N-lysine methyltransferase KMT5A-A-like n=1 Tax=Notolabrus celidotus TaxID=1203425 RepID=UPI00148FC902|nr:N-lysine methyltransferase KMT5A-A-like [Notolabrus celidotus]
MATSRSQRAKVKPKDEAAYFSSQCKDKDGFDIKYIDSFKGRGVFSSRHFQKGDFLVEYRGEVITQQEYERRHRVYHDALQVFMFEFRFNGKQSCIDAAREDGSLGRLVSDDHVNPNSTMETIRVDGKPHLCLFALKDISPGEEITYNYGDSDWPWRSKISPETDPQLRPNGGIQQGTPDKEGQGQASSTAEDAMGKISPETDPQLRPNGGIQQCIL